MIGLLALLGIIIIFGLFWLKFFTAKFPPLTINRVWDPIFRTEYTYLGGRWLFFVPPWIDQSQIRTESIEAITDEFDETFPTEDGAELHVKGSVTVKLKETKEALDKFVKIDNKTIKLALHNLVKQALGEKIYGQCSVDEAKKHISEIAKNVVEWFNEEINFDDKYGMALHELAIADADYTDDIKKARADKKKVDMLGETAKKLKTDNPTLSEKEALTIARIALGIGTMEDFNLNIDGEIKGLENLRDVVFPGALKGKNQKGGGKNAPSGK